MKTAKEILTQANLQHSHWGERIIAAEDRGYFSAEDVDKAMDWITCACGMSDPRIPKDECGAPEDILLDKYGNYFSGWVEDGHFANAATYLVLIEKRAAELVAKLEGQA